MEKPYKAPPLYLAICLLLCLQACKKDGADLVWHQLNSGTELLLHGVQFLNKDTGFVCGGDRYDQSLLLKTTDGGISWQNTGTNIGKVVFDVSMADETIGYATAYDNKLLHTSDGGQSWHLKQLQSDTRWLPLRAVFPIDANNILAVGGLGYNQGIVFATKDGFQHWTSQLFDEELRDLWFTDAQTGYAAGYGVVYKTQNGGQSWFPLDVEGDLFTAIHFPTPEVGYAVGNQGIIVKTVDAGHEWQTVKKVKSAKRQHYEDVFFANPDTGFVVGDGTVLLTHNGGIDWMPVNGLDFASFTGVFMPTDSTAYITGDNGVIVSIELN